MICGIKDSSEKACRGEQWVQLSGCGMGYSLVKGVGC